MAFHFLGKMSFPQTVYFSISNFLYKLTLPKIHILQVFHKKKIFLQTESGERLCSVAVPEPSGAAIFSAAPELLYSRSRFFR